MAICISCGNEAGEESKFCPECGTPTPSSAKSHVSMREEYAGKVIKCPNCGSPLGSYCGNCPFCGYEIREVAANHTVKQLSEQLCEIEAQRLSQGYLGRKKALEKKREICDRKITLIRSFGIPNSKEDLLDFAILAASNIDYSAYTSSAARSLSEAWMSSLRQSLEKARILDAGGREYRAINEVVCEAEKKVRRSRRKIWIYISLPWVAIFLFVFVLLGVQEIRKSIEGENYYIANRETHLEYMLTDIEDSIAEGDFQDARNKAFTLTFDAALSKEKSEYWERRQADVLRQIDIAEHNASA